MAATRNIFVYLLVNLTRYALPTRGMIDGPTRDYRRNIRPLRAVNSPLGFAVGAGADSNFDNFSLSLNFQVLGTDASTSTDVDTQTSALETLVRTIKTNAINATSLLYHKEAELITGAGDESGNDLVDEASNNIASTVGYSIALRSLQRYNIRPMGNMLENYRVRLEWVTKFGEPTDSIAESLADFNAATKVV